MESIRLSSPEAISEPEFNLSPVFFTYMPIKNLANTATKIITNPTVVYSGVLGSKILLIASTNEVIPAYTMIKEITNALRYSILPYPYGCL